MGKSVVGVVATGDIRSFVFGHVKILRYFREQMSSGIKWAAGHRSGNLEWGLGWRHLKVVASMCIRVELWNIFRK